MLTFTVVYKGYFVPVDVSDCPPLSTAPASSTTPAAEASAQWAEAPARIASKTKPPRNGVQQNTDIEVFNTDKSSTTPAPDKDKQPNINIEIHNVFSFGTTNASNYPPTNEADNKITVSQHEQNHSNPPTIFA